MMNGLTKAYYRPDEIAHLFSLSKRTVYRLIHSKKLTAIRVGRSIRVPREELQRLQKGQKKCVSL